jgi:hypothetical protein
MLRREGSYVKEGGGMAKREGSYGKDGRRNVEKRKELW